MSEIRYDTGGLGDIEVTEQGFLRIPAFVTRTGVLTYVRADGTEFKELRLPGEVFSASSMGSMALLPITDRHPSEMVGPGNVRSLQMGVMSEPKQDGQFVRATMLIQDRDLIDKINRGDAREVSLGYRTVIDETPGVFQGERYDAVQREIMANHAGLGPAGWGRAGSQVALHLDSADPVPGLGVERFDGVVDCPQNDTGRVPEKDPPVTVKIKIDGLEYEVEGNVAAAISKSGASSCEALQAATVRADAAEGARDEAIKATEALQVKLDAATDPGAIAAAVKARVELEATAVKIGGSDMKLDGFSDHEVMVACIKVGDSDFDAEGKSEGYISGRFDAIRCIAPARNDSRDNVRTAINGAPDVKVDSLEDIRLNSVKEASELGRAPLASVN